MTTNGDEKADNRPNNKNVKFLWVTPITQQWPQFSAPYRSRDDLSIAFRVDCRHLENKSI